MDDLTKIKGVLGCAVYAGNSPVAGTEHGILGAKASEIEQFWPTAASVISGNLQLGPVTLMVLGGPKRQVLLFLSDAQTVFCEIEPKADWRALAEQLKGKL